MDPIRRACAYQQRRVQSHASNSDSCAFFNLVTGPGLLTQVESMLPDHRERLFSPTETLSMSVTAKFHLQGVSRFTENCLGPLLL
jgi:hypothetical protein